MNSDRHVMRGDAADAGAASLPGYTAAEAAHAIQLYLDGGLSTEGFMDWLNGYPYGQNGPQPADVEDEINNATLAMRGFQNGTRDGEALRQELADIRSRLAGHAFSAGQEVHTGDVRSPSGRPIDRSFP